jgi:hypothetical protein
MKTKFVIFIVSILFFSSIAHGQVDSAQFVILQNQVNELIIANTLQANEIKSLYIQDYKKIEYSVSSALEGATALSTLAINTRILNVVSSAGETMLSINNISSSESMGFDFKEQLIKIASDVLVEKTNETNPNSPVVQRNFRINNLITSVVNNDIVQGLIKSNPISSTAYSLINQAFSASETNFISGVNQVIIQRGFTTPNDFNSFKKNYSDFSKSWNSLGGEFKGINQTERIISDAAIKTFTLKINDYIQIYDSLNIINSNFGMAVRNWESKYIQIVNEASVYKTQLANTFKTEADNKNTDLTMEMAKSRFRTYMDTTRVSLKTVIENESLKKPLEKAENFKLMENNINTAYLDFLSIQINFIDSYIEILNNTISKSNDKSNDFQVDLRNLNKTKKKLTDDKKDLEFLVNEFKRIAEIYE